jgi:hypothetical protein
VSILKFLVLALNWRKSGRFVEPPTLAVYVMVIEGHLGCTLKAPKFTDVIWVPMKTFCGAIVLVGVTRLGAHEMVMPMSVMGVDRPVLYIFVVPATATW